MLDTSALVGAWVRSFPPDVFPSLWAELERVIDRGDAVAPYEVLEELEAKADDLHSWVKEREDPFIVPTSRAVMLGVSGLLVDFPFLTKTGTGRNKADPFVITLAEQRSWTVVTEENGGSADKPRIPYVCAQRGIRSITPLELLRELGLQF